MTPLAMALTVNHRALGAGSFSLAIAAGIGYTSSRGLVGATAFPYCLSVGGTGGVLQGGAGYLARQLGLSFLDNMNYGNIPDRNPPEIECKFVSLCQSMS